MYLCIVCILLCETLQMNVHPTPDHTIVLKRTNGSPRASPCVHRTVHDVVSGRVSFYSFKLYKSTQEHCTIFRTNLKQAVKKKQLLPELTSGMFSCKITRS